ncbi:MAG: 3'(2'),5'-bisphosphate nucleotidase CysQ [Hyphomicrobiales bacterium]|nr:3'(2'),5'-bisphosphate nucleotidase CysQ [Hyphomicrobiales bacterium]
MDVTDLLNARILEELTSVVSSAAAAILAVREGSLDTRSKADQSPVTAADHAAETAILAGLARVLPGLQVVSEEAVTLAVPAQLADTFVLVDPLDGTRELVAGRDEFTVNIAIVSGGRPRLGIVGAPAQGVIWRGIEGQGAERLVLLPGAPAAAARERRPIRTRACPSSGLVATLSRSHLDPRTEALLARLPVGQRLACGSAVKFCQLAEGAADIYPRLATTCEWDVAAGHAILVAAGGAMTAPDGAAVAYGGLAANFRVPAFIAWGDPAARIRLHEAIAAR